MVMGYRNADDLAEEVNYPRRFLGASPAIAF